MIKVFLIHYNLLIQYQFLILHISFLINYIQFNSQGCGLYMKESVRKLGLIGAGLWAMTEDRVNELVKDLVDRGGYQQRGRQENCSGPGGGEQETEA